MLFGIAAIMYLLIPIAPYGTFTNKNSTARDPILNLVSKYAKWKALRVLAHRLRIRPRKHISEINYVAMAQVYILSILCCPLYTADCEVNPSRSKLTWNWTPMTRTQKAWALQFHTLQRELQLAVQGYSARFSILQTLELKPNKFTEAFSDSQFTFLIMHCSSSFMTNFDALLPLCTFIT